MAVAKNQRSDRPLSLVSLKARHCEREWMDQPDLEAALHHHALAALGRLNRISLAARSLWRPIQRLAVEEPGRRLRVIDLASGGGDVTRGLAKRAIRAKLPVEVVGCDISPLAIRHAQERADREGLSQVRFFTHDVVRGELPGEYDVAVCSLFLHHLSEDDAVRVMKKMAVAARSLVLIDDLRRSPQGYALVWLGCRLLTRSPVVHVDGPLSVRAAFTLNEAAGLAEKAGLTGFRLAKHWPQRFLLSWRKP
jgi:2-polyprenyl-3-methyl-5-hydroxy-6-metoxy-1,4-benzoquinol methylase